MKMKKIVAVAVAMVLTINITGLDNDAYGAAKTPPKPNVATEAANNNKPANKPVKPGSGTNKGTELTNIRVGGDKKYTRVVMDLTSGKKYNYHLENNNTRLVINVDGVYTAMKAAPATKRGAIKDLILATYGDTVQLIVDMKIPAPVKVYSLKNPDRIVIDLINEYEEESLNKLEEGLLQGKYVRFDSRGMLTAYMLDIDPKKFNIKMVLPHGNVSAGLDRLSSISRNYEAIAAINGGYFDWSGKFLIGDVRINGTTAGMVDKSRTGLIKKPDGSYDIGRGNYEGTVTVHGQSISFWGVNSPRGENAVILYNGLYGQRTETNEFGKEFVIRKGMVQAINQGNSEIPADGVVVSVHGKSQEYFANVKVGDRAVISETLGEEVADDADFYGAGPQLVKNGVVSVTSQQEDIAADIANGRAPRTAVGIKENGNILLLVVDGRQSHSIGATLAEMGQLLVKYGAVKGVNYDGGGSSEMVVKDRTVNQPSDGGERRIGNALIVVRK